MRRLVRVILGLTVLASLSALVLSILPGVLTDLFLFAMLLAFLAFPFVLIGLIVGVIVLLWRPPKNRLSRPPIVELLAIPSVAILALMLLFLQIPRQVAFFFSRSAFEAAIAGTPESAFAEPFGERLGVYRVDQRAIDPRGGAYFRVYAGADGLGPDTMSYGFVRKPNPHGSPFGAADYKVGHIVDDWHWFQASDDWYGEFPDSATGGMR